MKRLFLSIVVLLSCTALFSQRLSLSMNMADLAAFGTLNADAGLSVARKVTLHVGGRYNPWSFHYGEHQSELRNQQQFVYAGVRYWPWYVYSGWWMGGRLQWGNYSNGGIWRPALREGRNLMGLGLSAGYTYMLNKHFNLDFGVGVWGGYMGDYTLYDSFSKLSYRTTGARGFFYPDTVIIALQYVF